MLTILLLLGLTHYPVDAEHADAEVVKSSRKAWDQVKGNHGNSYRYSVVFMSFAGFGSETVIVVNKGMVVERRYRMWTRPIPQAPGANDDFKPDWVEKGADIGKHKDGAPARTMEQLYDEAQKIAERTLQPFEKRYVKTDKRGLLESAFVVDTRIADDAPKKGVSITKLTLEQSK
jgi:hypothetical protein